MKWRLSNKRWLLALIAVAAIATAWVLATIPPDSDDEAQKGIQALAAYGCSSCHTIPGVPMANGIVGPPLDFWGSRKYIAGSLINIPDNFVQWVTDPQVIEPGTAMPMLDVSDEDANDMAAYLYIMTAPDLGEAGVRGFGSDDSLPPLSSGAGRFFGD